MGSDAGVSAASKEAERLFDELKRMAEPLGCSFEKEPNVRDIYSSGYTVSVNWWSEYANTTDGSYLVVTAFKGRPRIGNKRYASDAKRLRQRRFSFDLNPERDFGWREIKRGDEVLSTRQLAEICIDFLTDLIRADRLRHL